MPWRFARSALIALGCVLALSPPAVARPNIVVVLTDDQTADSIGQMPWLSSRDDWLMIERAYVNQALCCPARATVLTGQYAHHHGVMGNGDGERFDDDETIAVWLRRAGYKTGLFGKYLNGFPWTRGRHYVPPGWDRWNSFFRGNGAYVDFTVSVNGDVRHRDHDGDYSTDYFAARARRFVRDAKQPFFAIYAPKAPHGPALPAARHAGDLAAEPVELPPNFNQVAPDQPAYFGSLPDADPTEITDFTRLKWESTLAVDEALEDLYATMVNRGIEERTLIVFLSDNGVSLGSHRLEDKNCLYEECVRVPMAVRFPGLAGGSTDGPVSDVDLASTFADLADADAELPQDGSSMASFLLGDAPWPSSRDLLLETHRDEHGLPNGWGLVTPEWKYTRLATGERELYDLAADPYELDNLADDDSFNAIEADLAARLAALRD